MDGEQYGFKSGTIKEAKKHLPIDVYRENNRPGEPWLWKCDSFFQITESLTLGENKENAEKKPNNINKRHKSQKNLGGISKNLKESEESEGTFENKNHVSYNNNNNINKLPPNNIDISSSLRMFEEIPDLSLIHI